jgi:alanine-glyoxylate transaminase/serine-glyoxylate transaminase/serine-pyruvate transaminase
MPDFPQRVLLGPGPSAVPHRVLLALARPTLGHLDPAYLAMMDETAKRLRAVFRTTNEATLALPGTGSSGMEAALVNLLEPGDQVLACIAGYFGERLADLAARQGARVLRVEAPWGETITADAVESALAGAEGPVKVVTLVHAETSTGAHQPVPEIARAAKAHGALLVLDAVTSLGGVPVEVDAWGVDVCYACSQKCLSAPPGLAPITISSAALAAIAARKTPCRSFYLDLGLLRKYWGSERMYHHTAATNLGYALLEALRMLEEEGLENRWARHMERHAELRAGLEARDLRYIPKESLPHLNAVHVPEGVDDAQVRRSLLQHYDIEIGAGLGPFKGKAWRIGLMGASATRANIALLLAALDGLLPR